MKLCELYQEENTSTFTYNHHTYNLNKVLRATDGNEVVHIPIKELKWILKGEEADDERVVRADLKAPILITKWGDKWATIDGFHRLTKAVKAGIKEIPAIKVSKEVLDSARIK